MTNSDNTPYSPHVLAVIVAYYPTPGGLAQLISALRQQVDGVVLIFNSPIDPSFSFAEFDGQMFVIENQTNIGLAAAQNIGIRKCIAESADLVLFLDQDSLPDQNLVRSLIEADRRLTEQGITVGGVGPMLIDAHTGTPWPFLSSKWLHTQQKIQPGEFGVCRADMLYSSGSLIRLSHFNTVGHFMEPLFIDHVDLEWCYRAAKQGLQFFGVPSILMRHQMGIRYIRFLGKMHPIHTASRNYYVFRNSVILLGLSHIPLRWKVNEIIRLIPRSIFYGVVGGDPIAYVSNCLRGIVDGILHMIIGNASNEKLKVVND
jgi:rhamnosyltransferase